MPYALPSRFRFPHDYAVYLHDILVGLVMAGNEAGVFNVELKLGPNDPIPRGLAGVDLASWLDEHYPQAAAELEYKSLIGALISDSCHFALEALRAAAKGKLTVAYALSRKPFKDNLFYLEWLLSNPVEFLEEFRKRPEAIEVGMKADSRRTVIREAIEKSGSSGIDADFLYELRYDRTANHGFSVLWDQATHLVTTFKQARTTDRNLNFVFSGHAEWESQWQHFYHIVPYLLYHTVRVVEALFASFASIPKAYAALHKIRRDLGFVLHSEWIVDGESTEVTHQVAIFQEVLLGLQLPCPRCRTPFKFHRSNMRRLVLRGTLACGRCRGMTDVVSAVNAPKRQKRRRPKSQAPQRAEK